MDFQENGEGLDDNILGGAAGVHYLHKNVKIILNGEVFEGEVPVDVGGGAKNK